MRSTLKSRYQHYLKNIPSVQLSSYACQLSNHHPSSTTSIHHTSMHIGFKKLMQCKQVHEYAHIKCNQSKFMSLLPLFVCFSCPRILIHLFSSMLLPLCPCPCPTSISFISHFSPCTILISPPFNQAFISLSISPPLSSISIKGVLLIDAKVCNLGKMVEA